MRWENYFMDEGKFVVKFFTKKSLRNTLRKIFKPKNVSKKYCKNFSDQEKSPKTLLNTIWQPRKFTKFLNCDQDKSQETVQQKIGYFLQNYFLEINAK